MTSLRPRSSRKVRGYAISDVVAIMMKVPTDAYLIVLM